jgi:hypothetical protein
MRLQRAQHRILTARQLGGDVVGKLDLRPHQPLLLLLLLLPPPPLLLLLPLPRTPRTPFARGLEDARTALIRRAPP